VFLFAAYVADSKIGNEAGKQMQVNLICEEHMKSKGNKNPIWIILQRKKTEYVECQGS